MQNVMTLLNLACGKLRLDDEGNHAERMHVAIGGLLAALIFASLWGLAAGSSALPLALGNAYKLPMLILLSSLSAIPAGLLAWKLSGATGRASTLLVSFSTGVFTGSLVLGVLSPLVALYYHSSTWAGPMLGLSSTFLALGVGNIVFVRTAVRSVPPGESRLGMSLPAIIIMVIQAATLVQLIALASPILPETTVFDGGVDSMVGR